MSLGQVRVTASPDEIGRAISVLFVVCRVSDVLDQWAVVAGIVSQSDRPIPSACVVDHEGQGSEVPQYVDILELPSTKLPAALEAS